MINREPAFYVGLFEALLVTLLSFHLFGLNTETIGAIMAVVTALLGVVVAWRTRDTLLGVGVGLAKALIALGVAYGLALTENQTAAVIALATIVLGAYNRTQTTPLTRGTFAEPTP